MRYIVIMLALLCGGCFKTHNQVGPFCAELSIGYKPPIGIVITAELGKDHN